MFKKEKENTIPFIPIILWQRLGVSHVYSIQTITSHFLVVNWSLYMFI